MRRNRDSRRDDGPGPEGFCCVCGTATGPGLGGGKCQYLLGCDHYFCDQHVRWFGHYALCTHCADEWIRDSYRKKNPTSIRQNPAINRIKYIAERYPAFIVLDTIAILCDTLGIEYADLYRHLEDQHREEVFASASLEGKTAAVLRAIEVLVKQQSFPSDKLWLWVARELRKASRTGEARRYNEIRDALSGKSTALTLWANQPGIDILRYSAEQVLEQLETFDISQHIKVPQGEVVMAFPDDWTIQRLTDPKQLDVEGQIMQNCVGQGGYDDQANVGMVLSLRDPTGKPHVTMLFGKEDEDSTPYFLQIRGKQNEPPAEKYLPYVFEIMRAWADLSDNIHTCFEELLLPFEKIPEYPHFKNVEFDILEKNPAQGITFEQCRFHGSFSWDVSNCIFIDCVFTDSFTDSRFENVQFLKCFFPPFRIGHYSGGAFSNCKLKNVNIDLKGRRYGSPLRWTESEITFKNCNIQNLSVTGKGRILASGKKSQFSLGEDIELISLWRST